MIKTVDVSLKDVAPSHACSLCEFMSCALWPLTVDRSARGFEFWSGRRKGRSGHAWIYGRPVLNHLFAEEEVMQRVTDAQRTSEQTSTCEGVHCSLCGGEGISFRRSLCEISRKLINRCDAVRESGCDKWTR